MNSRMIARRLMPRFSRVQFESIEPELRESLEGKMYEFREKTLGTENSKEPRNWLDFNDILVYMGLSENAILGFDNVYTSIRDGELKADEEVKLALLLKLSSLGFICGNESYCEQCIDELIGSKNFAEKSKKAIELIDNPLVKVRSFITQNITDGFLEQALKNYSIFNKAVHEVRDYIAFLPK